MATTAQQVFRKIVLHNKIMTEATVDSLLARFSNPEDAVKLLVQKEKLAPQKAKQLLGVYKKQLAKKAGDSGSSVLGGEEPKRKPTPDESFAAMFDEILSDKPASSGIVDGSDGGADGQSSSGVGSRTNAAVIDSDATSIKESAPKKTAAADVASAIESEETPAPAEPQPSAKAASSAAEAAPSVEEDSEPAAVATDEPTPKAAAPEAAAPAEPAKPVTPAGPIDPLVQKILATARQANASDVHIKSGEVPLMRLAGSLREIEGIQAIPSEKCRDALLTLLNSRQRETFLKTGDLDFCYDGGETLGRFRSNLLNQHRGTDGIFRLIPISAPSFEELGLPDTVKKFTEYKQGIVLITGPKGSGKTTTLAAMVDLINRNRPEHIITIEDPIEFVHPCKQGHVNQREVGPHTETFSAALRAALREAPDVIMVGEMRDLETTSLAITAAETGHLVFATLHTPDSIRTIDRVLDVFPPKEQGQIRSMLSESLRGIVSQLLVPSVDGKSQNLALEIMVNTSAIGNLIRESKTFQLRGIMQTGRRLGMILMDDSLAKLVKEGKTKKEDALAVAIERKQLEQLL